MDHIRGQKDANIDLRQALSYRGIAMAKGNQSVNALKALASNITHICVFDFLDEIRETVTIKYCLVCAYHTTI